MNRIDQIFKDRRALGQKTLMPYLTAGDPDLATTGQLLACAQRGGASICELGFAFSDPVADGPVIQASMTHVLEQGVRPRAVLGMVASVRGQLDIGLVAMLSYSIVYKLGSKSFFSDCSQAGIDGLIIPDLPLEESDSVMDQLAEAGLIGSLLISPTTDTQRAARIAKRSTGFVYLLARSGITGESTTLPSELPEQIKRLRDVTDLPIAVGFGISEQKHVQAVCEHADAAIVGSAIVRRIAQNRHAGPQQVVQKVESFIAELATGLAS